MESTSWRQYDSLMGIKPMLISKKISANGISGNQPQLLGVHVVGLEHLVMRLALFQKTSLGRSIFKN
jgi:hypothetical protein